MNEGTVFKVGDRVRVVRIREGWLSEHGFDYKTHIGRTGVIESADTVFENRESEGVFWVAIGGNVLAYYYPDELELATDP